jgi:hypothetical protein
MSPPNGGDPGDLRGHGGTDVSALSAVPVVPEPGHQLVPRGDDSCCGPAWFGYRSGENRARVVGNHHVESVPTVTAVGHGLVSRPITSRNSPVTMHRPISACSTSIRNGSA